MLGNLPDVAENLHRNNDFDMDGFRACGFPKNKTFTRGANVCEGQGILVTADPQVISGDQIAHRMLGYTTGVRKYIDSNKFHAYRPLRS